MDIFSDLNSMPEQNDFNNGEPKWMTGEEFLAQGEAEYKERLQNGLTINNLKVFFQKSNVTIQFTGTAIGFYEVDLEDCANKNRLLFWVLHLKNKSSEPGLLQAFLTILDDACRDVFNSSIKDLYIDGNVLDWENGTVRQVDIK
jgi:hypothetical protein